MTTIIAGVTGTLFGIILKVLVDAKKNSNPKILSPSNARAVNIGYDDKNLTHIFTKKKPKSIELATKMLAEKRPKFEELKKKEAKAQKAAESIREDLKLTIELVKSEGSQGVKGNAWFTAGAPKLRDLRLATQTISDTMNTIQQTANEIRFLEQVEFGNTKKQTLDNLVDRPDAIEHMDLKMDEIFDALNSSLELSMDNNRTMERLWLSDASMVSEE